MTKHSNNKMPKLLIISYARCGKDTVANILSQRGFSFCSSSHYCADKIMMPYFKNIGIIYNSVEDCYLDRVNHRETWFKQITEYNSKDYTRLSREILSQYDIHVGMRNRNEFEYSKHLYEFIIWINADKRCAKENISSCELTEQDASYVIDNNGTIEDLNENVNLFISNIMHM